MTEAASPIGSTGAATEASSGAAFPFRPDAVDSPFPVAGLAMLLLLLAIAVWAWWTKSRRGLAPWRTLTGPRALLRRGTASGVRIVESSRLDIGGRLHVVEWGDEQILVAVNGASPAVVLARRGRVGAVDEVDAKQVAR